MAMSSDYARPFTPCSTLHDHYSHTQSSSSHTVTVETRASSDKRYPAPSCSYPGEGTSYSPYVVDWAPNDPDNPYNWTKTRKWFITMQLALCTWTVSFGSSSYTGGIQDAMRDLNISNDVAILGISLYVLGFALGPLVFAPMVSDIWNARERGLASAIYATVPFLGPVIGPIVGGFVAENPHLGWHFNFWLIFLFSAITLCLGYIITPETYGPVLLRRRAENLTAASNGIVHYVSIHDLHLSRSFLQVMRVNLSRPFVFIVTEPIVLLLALYISVMYGTLYALFSAFPIVFQHHRGFTPGQGGLAFLGVGFGITIGVGTQSYQDALYRRAMDRSPTGKAPPEAYVPLPQTQPASILDLTTFFPAQNSRLHTAILGGILIPIGLFTFAW
ncbi:hypothetical protein H0H87_010247 [Tephrocybe sp. NHM501043]|nr:hypothetical protein H0H87_010247 [Tephrocybe sp. NHM501043]